MGINMSTMTAPNYHKTLTESGVPADTAYAQACSFDQAIVDLATKDDLRALAVSTRIDIDGLEHRMNEKLYTIRTLGYAGFVLLGIVLTPVIRIALIVRR
jgi:hypothetical protein